MKNRVFLLLLINYWQVFMCPRQRIWRWQTSGIWVCQKVPKNYGASFQDISSKETNHTLHG